MKKNYKVLCTICARAGSKGVKNKNIRKIAGKPLIAYSIEQAKNSGIFDKIVVSSDSEEILKISKRYNIDYLIKRPEILSHDHAPKIPVIRHALLESEKFFKVKFDYIIDLDVTSPLRNINDIREAFHLFLKNDYDILFSVTSAHRSPYFNMVEIDTNGKIKIVKKLDKPITRRQDSPLCYDMNASIYIWKRKILLEKDTLFSEKTGIYIMPYERSIDIDTEIDFEIVEFLLKRKEEKRKNDFKE